MGEEGGSGEGWVRKRTAVSFANAGAWGAQPSLMCLTAGSDRRSLNMLKKGKVHSFSFHQLSQLEALITVERTALKENGVSSRRPLFFLSVISVFLRRVFLNLSI